MNISKSSEGNLNDMKVKIHALEIEKQKLEKELRSREEMMNNLLSYIQSTSK